jgi:hypothetical protein
MAVTDQEVDERHRRAGLEHPIDKISKDSIHVHELEALNLPISSIDLWSN